MLIKKPVKQELPKCILSIDASYTRIGVAVLDRNGVRFASSVDLTKLLNRTQKRNAVEQLTRQWILTFRPVAIIVERVRVFAGKYISSNTTNMLAAMTARIVDTAYIHSFNTKPIPVFSVDTRSARKTVVGDSKADKVATVNWLKMTHGITTDHDAADAAMLGVYALIKGSKKVREQ